MKKKIGVLMGGISSERDISLMSAHEMIKHLDQAKFEAIPIEINKKDDVLLKCQEIDFALIGLHGKFGEDGCVQSILDAMEIPYSGCGPRPSVLAMDKDTSKKILRFEGIRTPDWVMVTDVEQIDHDKINEMGYPVFVKPNSGGSSVATSLVRKQADLVAAVSEALKYDTEVMIEAYIQGLEISTPMINGHIYPTMAIQPKGEFFDLKAKYEAGGSDEFVIELDSPLKEEIESMLHATWHALKLEAYARIDFLITEQVPYLLEVNTLPGMTPTSLLPKSYTSLGAGHTFTDLLTHLIDVSLKHKRN
ncbi:MAG: D-alanine--D-alanine ligase [Defluviitaleaceae bacterium]|nr:D-alanine--D-alanine ligase [Defluviitaleaceae bacterium]